MIVNHITYQLLVVNFYISKMIFYTMKKIDTILYYILLLLNKNYGCLFMKSVAS